MPFFYVSPVDPDVTSGHELVLVPGPTSVNYPGMKLGADIPTSKTVIVQQPTKDNRVRSWVWSGYPGHQPTYEAQFHVLQGFRSRYRVEAGLSPYIWVKDTVTKGLRHKASTILTAASTGNSSTTLKAASSPAWSVNSLGDGVVEILPSSEGGTGTGAYQIRNILSNTANTITVPTWDTIPNGAKYVVSYWVQGWYRARVLDVNRALRAGGGDIRYDTTIFSFVIDDDTWNRLG